MKNWKSRLFIAWAAMWPVLLLAALIEPYLSLPGEAKALTHDGLVVLAIIVIIGATATVALGLAVISAYRSGIAAIARSPESWLATEHTNPQSKQAKHSERPAATAPALKNTEWIERGEDEDLTWLSEAFLGLQQTARDREAQLHQMAFEDSLTGLANRQHFHAKLEHKLGNSDATLSLLLIDLNRFKPINDAIGHLAGDGLLRACAKRLHHVAHSIGVIALARLDGDEFAMLLELVGDAEIPTPESLSPALVAADIVHRALDAPFPLGDEAIDLRCSIGIGISRASDGRHGTASELMRRADVALTQAKVERLPTVHFDEQKDTHDKRLLSMLGELRLAMTSGQMSLYLQPKVDIRTGRVRGAEALLRWHHGTLGQVPPASFIGYAEKTGDIRAITTWVLGEAAQAMRQLLRAAPDLTLSVNVSALDLQSTDVVDRVRQAWQGSGLPSNRLVLEITEGALIDNTGGATDRLHELAAAGFLLSLDDFGTGFSCLSSLADLPLHELKVDQSFVRGMTRTPRKAEIAKWVTQLGAKLNLQVVAEGVEAQEELEMLEAWGCDMAQGYLVSRPLPMQAFETWLLTKGARLTPSTRRQGPSAQF